MSREARVAGTARKGSGFSMCSHEGRSNHLKVESEHKEANPGS